MKLLLTRRTNMGYNMCDANLCSRVFCSSDGHNLIIVGEGPQQRNGTARDWRLPVAGVQLRAFVLTIGDAKMSKIYNRIVWGLIAKWLAKHHYR